MEANITGGQGSRRAVAPSDDDDMERMGDKRITYKVLLGKSEGMSALGISRRRWRIILKRFVKKGIRRKAQDRDE